MTTHQPRLSPSFSSLLSVLVYFSRMVGRLEGERTCEQKWRQKITPIIQASTALNSLASPAGDGTATLASEQKQAAAQSVLYSY